jgi:effector-binding domain-containing protein
MSVEIRTVEVSKTAVVAGPLDLSQIMPSYDTVYSWLRGQSDVTQSGQNIALYKQGKEMEVGIEVDTTFEPTPTVTPSELPAGRVATATHTTGYGDLQRTYKEIEDFCKDNGHATTGITWEIYGDPDGRDHVDVDVYFLLA